ncbi:MAG: HAMP domain-containing histidine kinase [Cystobacterineae bacterium]|nr:HAMP domain-containing histidine kinase [Cystobacterineae bacterium]
MSPRKSKSLSIAIVIIFAVIGWIAYFGFRTLEHEVLLRHYQAQTLAQTRIAQAGAFIMNWLEQRATRFELLMELKPNDNSTLKTLDDDIEDVFVLQKNKLLYPDESQPLTQKEQEWARLLTPIVQEPSLLYGHSTESEEQAPLAGWFVINEMQEPVLLYWRNKNGEVIGFRVSYVRLLFDVVNAADFHFGGDLLRIKENGRLLYQSKPDEQLSKLVRLGAIHLPYPLSTWQIEYEGQPASTLIIYGWGSLFLLALMAIVGLVVFRFYREYTQTTRLAQQQVNFVSQVSHELKTPLTNIRLYAELLKEDLSAEDGEGLRYAEVIATESQRLSRLIQNVLMFARMPKLNIQPINLQTLIRQMVDTFTPSFQAKGMSIVVSMPEQISINSDLDRLTQIMSNFLSNAEKYAAKGKQVHLTIEKQAEHVDIAVRDYGAGIPEKEVKMIFQPFYRIKSAITEGVSGTGIGLTIARQLAESLGGEILVNHPVPGVQFVLRLKQS